MVQNRAKKKTSHTETQELCPYLRFYLAVQCPVNAAKSGCVRIYGHHVPGKQIKWEHNEHAKDFQLGNDEHTFNSLSELIWCFKKLLNCARTS